MLIQMIRKNNKYKGKVVGIMVAFAEENNVYVGWSLCHKYDKFSKAKGKQIAEERACRWFYKDKDLAEIPSSILKPLFDFIEGRAIPYYNDKENPIWVRNFRSEMINNAI